MPKTAVVLAGIAFLGKALDWGRAAWDRHQDRRDERRRLRRERELEKIRETEQ